MHRFSFALGGGASFDGKGAQDKQTTHQLVASACIHAKFTCAYQKGTRKPKYVMEKAKMMQFMLNIAYSHTSYAHESVSNMPAYNAVSSQHFMRFHLV